MNINIIIGKLDAIAQESSNDHTTKALCELIQDLVHSTYVFEDFISPVL